MPGVLGIYTGPDLTAAGIKNMPLGMAIPTADSSLMHRPSCPVLTTDKVRYVGDPVAIVVAETVAEAKDAAEAVLLDIEPLPAVTRASEAAAPGAPQLHDGVPGDVAAEFHYGDAEKVAAAFAAAAHVTRLEIPSNRIVVCPMEPRSAIAEYDAANAHWTLRVGCQGVFGPRNGLANFLGAERDKVRVLTGNVGGSFGMKSQVYPEYLALFHAARALGRPVKWTDERSESFVSDSRGRDHEMLPEDVPDSLDVQHIMEKTPSAFPNGCHIAEVEIDPEPGVVAVVKYTMVNDFGVIVNPMLVEGQAHGGVVQGIGQALMERVVFDEDGQYLTGSFTDYALPRAADAVMIDIGSHPVPAKTNPLGAKGCGEAGCAGSLPAVMNAVVDALSENSIRNSDMPATPFKVWQTIQDARIVG
jgi:CO/xanthine dehydrogenase Mo-binding subunit